ncbi:PKD domain-containing protein [Mucilaginibacter sp. UR6-1]|uniref:PKD domain-containing protein n=1 Tax=Mucilaginibacter sp. UR6-1 TaxID=1435643 RepID=UPI001E3B81C7|nr:PKD domain-containing protein [Mucilaginibacter sp. UR6-1]MCC8410150.1 PKD domain-containing protein [Mucilaginibacter sp. UR6-1]
MLWLLIICALSANAQSYTTSKGTKFWAAYIEHISGAGASKSRMILYIACDVSTSGTVNIADGSFSTTFSVPANGLAYVEIPSSAHITRSGSKLKGIFIEAKNPVAVYAHIFASAVSGATLLLPVNTLGKDYYSINYTQQSNSMFPTQEKKKSLSEFAVIATEDNTTVEITPNELLTDRHEANQPFAVKLKKGEVYQGQSERDLTSTRIRSISVDDEPCKKIAVFSGSTKMAIGCDESNFSSDNVIQQVYPTASWGKNYITVPLKNRDYDIFRVIFSERNTEVKVNGTVMAPQTPGINYIEFSSQKANVITANKPVQVVQYAVTQTQTTSCVASDETEGDPEVIYLNPLEQTLDRVTLYSANNFSIRSHYINVVLKTADAASFKIDGKPYNEFFTVPGSNNYSYAQIKVSRGVHNISASSGFNAIAYGFGRFESYGYSAGANLENLNERIVLASAGSNDSYLAGCSEADYYLQLTLPYKTGAIRWILHDGTEVVDNNPRYNTVIINERELYVYRYVDKVKYTPGDYNVKAFVYPGENNDCGSTREVDFEFNITAPPVADFTAQNVCLTNEVAFVDNSRATANTIKNWHWDFGDGTTADVQSPSHLYASQGSYKVTLVVTNANGCIDATTQTVAIAPPPEGDFTYAALLCSAGETVRLTGTSPTLTDIAEWRVDFGDGTPEKSFTDNKLFHQYSRGGVYTVSLRVRAVNASCYSEPVSHALTVNTAPVTAFTVPEICTADVAKFENKTLLADGTAGQITYSWNFGDPASGANNNSNATDGEHRYATAGRYTVTLTAFSNNGCAVSRTAEIVVNGGTISGNIDVENRANLCVSEPVTFINKASVNSGKIIKVEWYFDVLAKPADKVSYTGDNMPADGRFSHMYEVFSSPATKTIRVKMVAYSGQSCFEEYTEDITLYAQPQIDITSSAGFTICEDAGPVNFMADFNGLSGTGTYSGAGISAAGVFTPATAGVGTHSVTYTFRSANGCPAVKNFDVVVSKLPVVTVPDVVNVFNNRTMQANIQATGDGLTYKWVPSAGLDRDDVLNPNITLNADMSYRLIVTSASCSVTKIVNVKVHQQLTIPNTFTPNGDGINDTWNIDLLKSFPDCVITVVNRNGSKVFTSVGYQTPWNGTINGNQLPAGTYYYTLDLKDGSKLYTGYLTLLK